MAISNHSSLTKLSEHTSVVAEPLASFVDEEDVIDQLHRECFTNTGSKGGNYTTSHQCPIAFTLRCADQARTELRIGSVKTRTTADSTEILR